VRDESRLAGVRAGHLVKLFEATGAFASIEQIVITVDVEHPSFEEWWEPFTRGVGPAGAYVGTLDADRRVELRARCQEALPTAPFTMTGRAWAVRGIHVPGNATSDL
jgi:hypothetical protein